MRRTLLILSALSLVMAGCSTNPATNRSQLLLLSSDEVRNMGEAAKPELVKEYGGEHPSAQLRSYVADVGRSLATHTEAHVEGMNWEFIVLNSEVINAFALPGGKVFISRGLLERFENEAQVAGVLGHEIGHVTGRHTDERISQAMAAELGVAAVGLASDSELVSAGASLFANGYLLKFNRDQESEADTLGLRYMARAGYDPHGMMEVLQVLNEATQESGAPPEFLSTHPHPETRLRTVGRLLEGEYAFTQNNPSFSKHRDRFQQQAAPILRADALPRGFDRFAASHWCSLCAATPAPGKAASSTIPFR